MKNYTERNTDFHTICSKTKKSLLPQYGEGIKVRDSKLANKNNTQNHIVMTHYFQLKMQKQH